jgi:hypothetical protein
MSDLNKPEKHTHYQIRVEGRLQEDWTDWLNGNTVRIVEDQDADGETVILIKVLDQAALRGIVTKLWDLNLTVISMNILEKER